MGCFFELPSVFRRPEAASYAAVSEFRRNNLLNQVIGLWIVQSEFPW